MQGIKHYLIDEFEPDDEFNVNVFKSLQRNTLMKFMKRKNAYYSRWNSFIFSLFCMTLILTKQKIIMNIEKDFGTDL